MTILAKAEDEVEDLPSDGFALTVNSSKIERNEGKCEAYIREDRHKR